MDKIKVFEAFSGIGTQHMALERLRQEFGLPYEIVGVAEINEYSLMSYTAIHGQVKNYGDISLLSTDDLPDMDLFTYSFPCQDISKEGKGQGLSEGAGTRSSILWECKRIIEAKKPKYLLLENVKNLVSKKHIKDFDNWNQYLSSLGYTTKWAVLKASEYGVPQARERVYSVSILNGEDFNFPVYEGDIKVLADILEDNPSEEYYLPEYVLKQFELGREDDKLLVRANTKKGFEYLAVGDSYNYIHPSSKTRRGRVGRGVTPTLLTAVYIGVLTEDYRLRKLTPLESWRLTGMKDEDYFKAVAAGVPKAQLYKQAGNAIVVDVLVSIFKQLFIK